MSITLVRRAEELDARDGRYVVGFFGAFSAKAREAQPDFEAFAAKAGVPVLLVDVGEVKGVHQRFGVDSVPSAVTVDGGRVIRRAAGAHSVDGWAEALLPHDVVAGAATKADAPKRPTPVVYTTPTCVWCGRVKSWLTENGVAFREVNIAADDAAAARLVARSGQQGVPQIEVGPDIVVGFDKPRLAQLLGVSAR